MPGNATYTAEQKKAIKVVWAAFAGVAVATVSAWKGATWYVEDSRLDDALNQCEDRVMAHESYFKGVIAQKRKAGEPNPEIIIHSDFKVASDKWYGNDWLYKCSVTVPETDYLYKRFRLHVEAREP